MNKNQNHKSMIQSVLWGLSVGIVIVIGMYYFPRECDNLNFCGALYYTIRLFIMEHDLSAFPKAWPLIFIYFFAPLLTLSAIGKAIAYFFKISPSLRTKWMSDHVVVCGVGRTGKILAATLKKKGVFVVGVDNGNPDDFDEWRAAQKIPMVFGDFHSKLILKRAGAHNSRAIIFAAGDDLLNLEGAVGAYGWMQSKEGPYRLIWTHIANENLANMARLAMRTEGKVGIRIFDTYQIAAQKMITKYLHREAFDAINTIYILGFGKFGRDLLDVCIQSVAVSDDTHIRVVDLQNRKQEVIALAREHKLEKRISFTQADICQLEINGGNHKAFFLCTDDDIGNLSIALMLTTKMDTSHIYVRMAKWPIAAIEEHLRQKSGVTFININELVMKGIKDLPGIFQPARAMDLKRLK